MVLSVPLVTKGILIKFRCSAAFLNKIDLKTLLQGPLPLKHEGGINQSACILN